MGNYDFPHGGEVQMGNSLERAFFTEWKSGAQNVNAELSESRVKELRTWVSTSAFCT